MFSAPAMEVTPGQIVVIIMCNSSNDKIIIKSINDSSNINSNVCNESSNVVVVVI
jgi:hypothetical protein